MGDTDHLLQDAHRLAPAAPDEECVYGSCAPGWHSAGEHALCIELWIGDMRRAGIERVCCLLPGRHLDDANLARYRTAFGPERVLHAPVPDHHLIGERRLEEEVLPFLDAADRTDESVVVHALAGVGRTGQVLAAWLVYDRGCRPEEAVETVRQLGRDPLETVRRGAGTETELFDRLEAVATARD